MRSVMLALVIACSGAQQAPPNNGNGSGLGSAEPVAKDTRTPFDQRRDAACKQLGPRLTTCAADAAKADLAAGKITQQQYQQDTQPAVLDKNTEVFVDKCTGWRDMSSRQVRVLEVCYKEATECGALRDCLQNLEAKPASP